MPQKANLEAVGATQLQHSLVAGLFIPQFDDSDDATLVIADPEWSEVKELLSGFSRDQIGRAVVQVAQAKELAILDLPTTANTLVRAPGTDQTIADAVRLDLSRASEPNRRVTDDGVTVEREHRWSQPVKIGENLTISGVRFRGSLSAARLQVLTETVSPAALGERILGETARTNWIVEQSDTAVTLRSPFDAAFQLELLEE